MIVTTNVYWELVTTLLPDVVDIIIISDLLMRKKGGSDEFLGHMVTKEQRWDWIPGCLTLESLGKCGLVAQPTFPKQAEFTFRPYQHWDLEATELKARRSQSLENNLGSFQWKELNRLALSIIAGLKQWAFQKWACVSRHAFRSWN